MIPSRHEVWQFFSGTETFESFTQTFLQPIFLKSEVNSEIKAHVASIEKLLRYSYYEYEFIDTALLYAVFTLEKAMIVRLKELNLKFSNDRFKNLSKYFFDNNYFDTYNFGVLEQLRDIRNGKVHHVPKSLGGSVFLSKVYVTIDMINDLYEDVNLRTTRKSKVENLNVEFHNFLINGGIIKTETYKLIIHRVITVFINNKVSPELNYLVFYPIYDPKPFTEGNLIDPKPYSLRLTELTFSEGQITGIDVNSNSKVVITKAESENLNKFNSWREQIANLDTFSTMRHLENTNLNKDFNIALREFHRTK